MCVCALLLAVASNEIRGKGISWHTSKTQIPYTRFFSLSPFTYFIQNHWRFTLCAIYLQNCTPNDDRV